MMERERRSGPRGLRVVVVLWLAAMGLAGCSDTHSVGNPVDWARGLVGLSPQNAEVKNAPYSKAMKQGSKEPYPNLASVPPPPETSMTRIDRDKLAQSLIADRRNADYTAEELRPGQNMAAPPPAVTAMTATPAPVAAPSIATKSGPPLRSPTIANLPKGEMPKAPPPTPAGIRHDQKLGAAAPAPTHRHRPSNLIAEVREGPGGTIPAADRARLAGIARRALRNHARIRVVGHGDASGRGSLAQRKFLSFDAALNNAKAVAVALTRLGVPADRIDVETAATTDASNRADIYLID
ncbi:MAG: hypothetical protein ACREFD_16225 [Stellaceae bacterium]